MTNRTFAIIKPDAVKNNNTGLIFDHILKAGFNILSAKLIKMSLEQAEGFYAIHSERPFFSELTQFMSSGQCMVLALEKENAVSTPREVTAMSEDGIDIEGQSGHDRSRKSCQDRYPQPSSVCRRSMRSRSRRVAPIWRRAPSRRPPR